MPEMSPETVAILEDSALARSLSTVFYALPCVTASVWLPITYLLGPWYVGLLLFAVSCVVWIPLRKKPSATDWKLSLLAARLARIRYGVIGLTAIYFGYQGKWFLLFLTLATTPLCGAVRLFMMSGKALEVDDIQSRFFDDVLAARGHSLTEK